MKLTDRRGVREPVHPIRIMTIIREWTDDDNHSRHMVSEL